MAGHRTTLRDAGLWWVWFSWVTIGGCVGFGLPAAVGAVLGGAPTVQLVTGLLAAGTAGGATLGTTQAIVLRRVVPGLASTAYVLATAAAAALASTIGLLVSLLGDRLADLPLVVVLPAAALGALVLLGAIGTAQWLVLRRRLPAAAIWVPATGTAWAAGLLVFLAIAPPLWQPGQRSVLTVAIGVLAGLAMAAVVAAVTGWALCRWLLHGG